MIQHFMHEILVGSSHYFTSYCNESGHLCETLKVHKTENFFGLDLVFCTISMLVMHK